MAMSFRGSNIGRAKDLVSGYLNDFSFDAGATQAKAMQAASAIKRTDTEFDARMDSGSQMFDAQMNSAGAMGAANSAMQSDMAFGNIMSSVGQGAMMVGNIGYKKGWWGNKPGQGNPGLPD